MKTPKQFIDESRLALITSEIAECENIMQLFAQQQSIAFAEWCAWRGWNKKLLNGNNEWTNAYSSVFGVPTETTEKLYQKFINQSK